MTTSVLRATGATFKGMQWRHSHTPWLGRRVHPWPHVLADACSRAAYVDGYTP